MKIIRLKTTSLTFRVLVMTLMSCGHVYADTEVNVDRVKWKEGAFNWIDHDQYLEWKDAGVGSSKRKKTYISKYISPSVNDTKTMIMLIAGQQGSSGSSGSSNCLTGQNQYWDSDWGKGDKTKVSYIKNLSLAERLIDSGHVDPFNTFFTIVFNSNFNWEATEGTKDKTEQAFTNWLLTHGNSSNVERIVLLGSSRGGALATRISKNIKQRSAWSNVPVYVGLLDAVPNVGQNELETTNQPTCTNPLNINYYGRGADLGEFFGTLNKPQIRHVVTGAPVILDVRGFCAEETSWYEQSWANLEHKEIGRCNSEEGGAYDTDKMNTGIVLLYNWVIEKLYE